MKHPTLRPAIVWEAHEFVFQEKTSDWYWAVGIIAISIAVLAVIYGNTLLALLSLIAGFTLSLFAAKQPHFMRFETNNSGVIIEQTLYPYATLDSFWVENNVHLDLESKLILKSKHINPLIVIPLSTINPEIMRDFLLDHLPEAVHTEPFAHKLFEYFGF